KSKTDVVVMKNGDKFTGEVKGLQDGFLYFKADYMSDTIKLDWKLVESVESKDDFTVILSSGTRETGILQKGPELGAETKGFVVHSEGVTTSSRVAEVVAMTPVADTFWHQLTGSINYGFSFTGGTSSTQSNFSGEVGYRAERWAAKLDGSSVFSRQNGADNSGRNSMNLYYYKYRGQRWFVAGTASFLNSLQQDLTARTTFGGGIGWDLIRSSTASLQLISGAVFNNERYSPTAGSKSGRGADAQLLMQYSKYAFTKF